MSFIHALKRKLKKFRDADERILKIVHDFGIRSNIEFLRSIAHNYLSILPIKACLRLKCVFFRRRTGL
jgi:hypothetical protein